MRTLPSKLLLLIFTLAALAISLTAQPTRNSGEIARPVHYSPPPIARSATLRSILDPAFADATMKFPGFKPEQFAVTVIDITDAAHWRTASLRGDARVYPASVVKLFYLTAIEKLIEDGRVSESAELKRGIRDMIVDSSNEATQYVLDVITDTSSGAELPVKQFDKWQFKRNRVNRFYSALGYENINVNQKTFCEDAYGVEQQSRSYKGENRNMLTTDAAARLMAETAEGRIVSGERKAEMMELLKRDPFSNGPADDQAHGFTGRLLIERNVRNIAIWSKAGWTSKARHDVAYLELPNGKKVVIAIFTEDHANDTGFIPFIAGRIIDALMK